MLTCPYCLMLTLHEERGFRFVCDNCPYTIREGHSIPPGDVAIIWPKEKAPVDIEERLTDIEERLDIASKRSMRLSPQERDDIIQLKGHVQHLENQLLKHFRYKKRRGEY